MENQRIVLASHPEGWVTPENFRLEKAPLPAAAVERIFAAMAVTASA